MSYPSHIADGHRCVQAMVLCDDIDLLGFFPPGRRTVSCSSVRFDSFRSLPVSQSESGSYNHHLFSFAYPFLGYWSVLVNFSLTHSILIYLCLVSVAAPDILRLHQIYRSITQHHRYNRSHWFHLSPRRRKQLVAKKPYTVCIASTYGPVIRLGMSPLMYIYNIWTHLYIITVVTDNMTAGEILQLVIDKELVPSVFSQGLYLTSVLYDKHPRGRLESSTKMSDLDIGDAQNIHVCCLVLGMFSPSSISRAKYIN